MTDKQIASAQAALDDIRNNPSIANFEAVYEGCAAKGIHPDDVTPKENVLTYRAWQALRRQVRKGEKGIKVKIYIRRLKKGADPEEDSSYFSFPKSVSVFHVSQTDPMEVN
jgi:antirestriction protein ArdC